MGSKNQKRRRESQAGDNEADAPNKRQRQSIEERLKLSKLYEDLAAESDDVRLEAAKQLIVKFSPENKPNAKEVETALGRLIKGMCSQRKAARVGFSLTLTELLRQIFGQTDHSIEGLELDVAAIINLIEEKTKVEGHVPGRERRDHLIGKLFCYKAMLQSTIVIEPELSLQCWQLLQNNICAMARDIPWLREECGLVLFDAVRSLKARKQYQNCAKETMDALRGAKLLSTPQGVAVWIAVQASYEDALPEGVWNGKDPLSKKERSRLAKVLKENFQDESENGAQDATKTAGATPNPSFAWDIILSEILQKDEQSRSAKKEKLEFPQFWIDTIDSTLFSSTSSHERKAWGFKILSSMITKVPDWAVPALFSPNLMRTLINQSKKENRFLHSAAVAALGAVQLRAEHEPSSAPAIFVALTTNHGSVDFDRITKTKTLEGILQSADDDSLLEHVGHLRSVILRPGTDEDSVAVTRRQIVADLLLNLVKRYSRFEDMDFEDVEGEHWLRALLETLVDYGYFTLHGQGDKKMKLPLPPINERSRTIFQERLSSCLTKLLTVDVGSRSAFASLIVGMIRRKSESSKKFELVFKAEGPVMEAIEKAFKTMESISKKGSVAGNKLAAEAFSFLYSLTLLQVYNGEGDAVMMLDDLDDSRKAMIAKHKEGAADGQDGLVEIILSFVGNERTLFRKIGEEAFAIFAANIGSEGLQSLTDILDTEENLEGQKELFNQDGDDVEEDGDSDDSDEVDSDVEMIDGESEDSGDEEDDDDEGSDSEDDSDSEGSSDDDDENEEEQDDAELTQFNNLLALTLQTQKLQAGAEDEETSDESDMDDEQMMALDPHLSKIFKERSKTTSKKKQREDAKQSVVQFKSRALDLLAIYLEKQYSNPLTLEILLPVLRRTRAAFNKQIADKAAQMLKTFFDSRTKHKAPLPQPEDTESVWALLKDIHEEAKQGGGAKVHANACSLASLHVVKVLVGLDRENYEGVVDVYAATQKEWFMDRKSSLQADLFMQFQVWTQNTRQQKK